MRANPRRALLALAVVVVALLVLEALRVAGPDPSSASPTASRATTASRAIAAPAQESREAPEVVGPPLRPSPSAAPEPLQVAATTAPASAAPPAGGRRITWRGRVLQPGGQPAAGVPWTLELEVAEGVRPPVDAAPPAPGTTGATGPDGRFEISFAAIPSLFADLQLRPPGLAPLRHWTSDVLASLDVDFGDITLCRGATIHGLILDHDQRPLLAPCEVYCQLATDTGRREGFVEHASVDANTAPGRFVISGLLPGPHGVSARVILALPGEGSGTYLGAGAADVVLAEGTTEDVTLHYEGPDLAQQVSLLIRGAEGRPCFPPDPELITLHGAGLQDRHPVPERPYYPETQRFVDVPPGTYTLEIRDPAYLPWRRDDVQPGLVPVLAELEGPCALQLLAVDAADASPIETFGAHASVKRTTHGGSPADPASQWVRTSNSWDAPLCAVARHAQGRVLIDRLPADALEVTVDAPGYASFTGEWEGVPPGATGTLTAALHRVAGVAGRVLEPDGAPAARVPVGLYSCVDDSADPSFVSQVEYWNLDIGPDGWNEELRSVHTDDDGRFELSDVHAGKYFVRAWRSSDCDAWQRVEVADGRAVQDVALRLPVAAEVSGRVVENGVAPGRAWALAFAPAPSAATPGAHAPASPVSSADHARIALPVPATTAVDGSFRAGPFKPGDRDVFAVPCVQGGAWQPVTLSVPAGGAPGFASFQGVNIGGPCVYLGRIAVPAPQDAPVVFEVSPWVPGSLRVQAVDGGQPLARVLVRILASESAPADQPVQVRWTEPDGWATFPVVFAGTYWVTATSPDPLGARIDARPVTLKPGSALSWQVDAGLRDVSLECVDEVDGAPLQSEVLCLWRREGDAWKETCQRSDAGGRVALRLPAGELRIARLGAHGDDMAPKPGETQEDFFMRTFGLDAGPGWSLPEDPTLVPHARNVGPLGASGDVIVRLPAPPAP